METAASSGAALAAFSGANAVDLITGMAWPLLIGVALWRLLPSIRDVMKSRAFTVKAGGMEISVQQASDQLASRLDDVRDQVSALTVAPSTEGAAPTEGLQRLGSVLWVDDFPQNNAFEVEALQRKGVDVIQALTTNEALQILADRPGIDVIISDMGRVGDGPDAGVKLVGAVHDRWPDKPLLIYASAPAIAQWGQAALDLGAAGVTASATELMGMLGRIGAG